MSKFIKIKTIYRDISGFVTMDTDTDNVFLNDVDITLDALNLIIERYVGFEIPILAENLGLTNIAPVRNDWFEISENDTPFIEIVGTTDYSSMNTLPDTKGISHFIYRCRRHK